MLSNDEILDRLPNLTPVGNGYKAKCPLHDSKSGQNLTITYGDNGKLLAHCFGQGCSFEAIVAALTHSKVSRAKVYARPGFEWKNLAGNVVAYHQHKGSWYRPLPGGYWVTEKGPHPTLYNLPEVLCAIGRGDTVYVVEGEKDAETLRKLGLTATTTGGATSWKPQYSMYLHGANVVICPDNDEDGKKYAAAVYRDVSGVAASIGVLVLDGLSHKEDVTDWFNEHGGTLEDFLQNARICVGSQFPFPKYMVGNGNGRIVRLSEVSRPKGSQPFLIERVVPEAFPTVFFGDSGTLKTTLAIHLGLSVASGADEWLGFAIARQASTLFVDFELDQDTFVRKIYDLAKGMGLDTLPDTLHYVAGAGRPTKETLEDAIAYTGEHGIELVVIDSLGIAMDGDMDSAKTVVKFMHDVMDRFRALGTTSVMVDHQGKLQMGESYQGKTQYGNSFKKHLIRSQFQIEGKDGGLTIRHKKTNFGPLLDPFGVRVEFGDEEITVEAAALTQSELAEEQTVSVRKRILIALEDGPAFTDELAERLNTQHKTLSNRVSDLVKSGRVEYTGRTENRYKEVRLKDNDGVCADSQDPTPTKGMGTGNERIHGDDSAYLSEETPEPETGQQGGVHGAGNGVGDEAVSVITTDGDAAECVRWLETLPTVALDIETYGKTKPDALMYLKGTIRLIAFHGAGETRVVDMHRVSDERGAEMLRAIEYTPKYLHNAVFDLPRLYRRTGVMLKHNVFDTAVASRTARAGETERTGAKKSHSLGPVLERELGVKVDKEIDHKWGEPLTTEHIAYAVNDVRHLERLHDALARLMERRGVKERYDTIRETLPTFIKAASLGVPVDRDRLEELSTAALKERDRLRAELDALAPEHLEGNAWTWNTSKNTGATGPGRNGALRALALVGVELENLQDQTLLDHRDEHPLVAGLQDYRKKAQEYSKYRRWIPDFYGDGHIYPQPKVAGAVTSRLLYSDPNVQGIEKHKTKEYRKIITPGPGRCIVAGDFAQQELRIAALISGDEEMIRTFASGEDAYLKTASKMVGYEITDKNHPARAGAKRATLGFLYGLGIEKYRENTYKDYGIALSQADAHRDREAFRAAFPEFYAWQREYGALNDRETRSLKGWRRVVGMSKDRNGRQVPKYTDRLNGPIQSTAGDILYLALASMQGDWPEGARFLMGVHDEIVIEAPEETARDAAVWLHAKMVEAFEDVLGPELGGPESVEVGYGPSWGEQKELEIEEIPA